MTSHLLFVHKCAMLQMPTYNKKERREGRKGGREERRKGGRREERKEERKGGREEGRKEGREGGREKETRMEGEEK